MTFVKTMKRKNKNGSTRIYYYLAENYRDNGKVKVRLFGRLLPEEAQKYGKQVEIHKEELEQPGALPVEDSSSEKEQTKAEILVLAQRANEIGRKMFRTDILKTVQAEMEAEDSKELEKEFQKIMSKLQKKAQRSLRIDKYLSERTLREMVEDGLLEKPGHRYCLP